jgi:hypothetical protein
VKLPKGALSKVVRVSSGWAIFRVDEASVSVPAKPAASAKDAKPATPAKDATPADTAKDAATATPAKDATTDWLATIRDFLKKEGMMNDVRDYLTKSERGTVEDYLIAQAKKMVATPPADFVAAAKEHGATAGEFGPITLNYGDSKLFPKASDNAKDFKSELNHVEKSVPFWKNVFDTPIGGYSEPFVIDASLNSVVILHPTAESDDAAAIDKAKTTFTGDFFETQTQSSINNTIMHSPLFHDHFADKYDNVFPPEPPEPPAK